MKKITAKKKMNLNKELVSKLNENQLSSLKGGLPTGGLGEIDYDDDDDQPMETGYGPCVENATVLCYVK